MKKNSTVGININFKFMNTNIIVHYNKTPGGSLKCITDLTDAEVKKVIGKMNEGSVFTPERFKFD